MVYDMLGAHGMPSREKDAVQHLLKLRRTTPAPVLKSTMATTFATTTSTTTAPPSTQTTIVTDTTTELPESTLNPQRVFSDYQNSSVNISIPEEDLLESSAEETRALPYVHNTKDRKSNSRRNGKQRYAEMYDYETEYPQHRSTQRLREILSDGDDDKENYRRHWTSSEKRRDPEAVSRIMNNGMQLVPRPFRPRNFTTERPTNNRIKIIKNDVIPHYSFTSPSKYPQLSAYRYPNEAKNIQDIIKYLSAGGSTKSPSFSYQDTIPFQTSNTNRKIKFAGVYKTAEKEDVGETYRKPDETMNEYMIAGQENKMSDVSSLNGHAYNADPFHEFKPSDPSEINLLANSDFRFSPIDNRIRITSGIMNGNRWSYSDSNPNDKYFPRPPINFGKPSPAIQYNQETVPQAYPGTYTMATFKPFGKETQAQPSNTKKSKKTKPFSVMLDIYPMMEDAQPQATANRVRQRGRPGGPGYGRVRFPHAQPVRFPPDQVAESSENKHQMIVHLNLYPKKKKNPGISNRYVNISSSSSFYTPSIGV